MAEIILGTADGDKVCCLVDAGDGLYVGSTFEGTTVWLSVGEEVGLAVGTKDGNIVVVGSEVGHLVLEHLAVIQGENKGRDPDCLVRG